MESQLKELVHVDVSECPTNMVLMVTDSRQSINLDYIFNTEISVTSSQSPSSGYSGCYKNSLPVVSCQMIRKVHA